MPIPCDDCIGCMADRDPLGTPAVEDGGDWVLNSRVSKTEDLVAAIRVDDAVSSRFGEAVILARLGDAESEVSVDTFAGRWRQFLACMNLFQFCNGFRFWTTSSGAQGAAPDIELQPRVERDTLWDEIRNEATRGVRPIIDELELRSITNYPRVDYYDEDVDEGAYGELVWPEAEPPVAVLIGGQVGFLEKWRDKGWTAFTPGDVQAGGIQLLIDAIHAGKE